MIEKLFRMFRKILAWVLVVSLLAPLSLSHVSINAKAADLGQSEINTTELEQNELERKSNEEIEPSTETAEETTIDETVEYTITYEVNGGALPESGVITTYTAESTVTLPVPTKVNYEFKGWYEAEDFSGENVTEFVGGNADKTFYAKWETEQEKTNNEMEETDVEEPSEEGDVEGTTAESSEETESAVSTTDLSADGNWSISLNWGDPSENLPDNWCPVYEDESSVSVKTQITIEYRGDGTETFAPKDIVVTSQDIKDILIESLQYNVSWNVSTSALPMDSTGNGDWWYNRTYSTGEYKFYNKNTITGSFTSTIQFNITFSKKNGYVARYFKQDFTKDITAALTVNGETVTSNTLSYSWQGTKDTYSLEWEPVESLEWGNSILSKIDKDKWNDYIFVNVPIQYNLETGSSLYLLEGGRTQFNFPSDFIVGDAEVKTGNLLGDSSGDIIDFTNMGSTFGGTTGTWAGYQLIDAFPIAIPRSYLSVNSGVIELKADWYGTYLGDTEEVFIATDTISFNLNDYDIVYEGNLYRQVKEHNPSYQDGAYLFTSSMKGGYGKDELTGNRTLWGIESSAIYYGVPYNLVIGDDLQYFIYSDNTYRKVSEVEVAVSSVSLYKPNSDSTYDVEVYGRKAGSDSYVLLDTVTITEWVTNVTVSTDNDRYCDFKVKYLNLEETVTDLVTTAAIYIYDNVNLDSGKTITDCYNFSYLQIELIGDDGSTSFVSMEYNGITNIAGLKDAVVAIDNSRYGKTILRGVDSTPVKDPYYSAEISTYGSSFYYDDTNMIFKYPGVPHTMLLKNVPESELNLKGTFIYSVTYPEYVKINTDTLVYSIQEEGDVNNRVWLTEEEFESKYDVTLSVSFVNNGDGTVTYNFNCNYKDGLSFTSNYKSNYIFNIRHDIFTTLDDYYLYGVASKKSKSTDSVDTSSSYVVNMDDGMDYVYECDSVTSTLTYPTIAYGSYQGVDIEVAGENDLYQKSLLKVDYDENYKYKLRVSSGDTRMADIIMYYNIENYTPDTWKGTFKGHSFASMENADIDTSVFKVYYSSNRTQTQDLSASGWVLSSDWTQSLSNVKSIAFDLDGYILEADSLLYVEVLMQAPSSTDNIQLGEITKSQDTVSYVEYDSTDTNLSNPLKTTTNLPSNIVPVSLGEAKIDINVNKIWSDNENAEGTRPSSVTIHLHRNGTEIDSYALKDSEDWKHTFNELVKYDDSLNEYEYTVTEDDILGYTGNIEYITGDNDITVNITNTIETLNINGAKTWVGDTEAQRPESITVNLLNNGVIEYTTTTTAEKNWQYSFENVPKYNKDGSLCQYSVSEEAVDGYTTTYGEMATGNGLAITFNNQFRTESANWDYVEIYYNLDGATYKLGRWCDTSLAGQTVEVPTTDFYLYWKTDGSNCNFYGFSIDAIASKDVAIPSASVASLPPYEVEEISGKTYPESPHTPYKDGTNKVWHYTAKFAYEEPETGIYDIINTLAAFPLEFIKTDFFTGDALSGVSFNLYELTCANSAVNHDHGKAGDTSCWIGVSQAASDAGGKVRLKGLVNGNTYGVVETVPDGYILPDSLYWKVSVGEDGEVSWTTVCDSGEKSAFANSYSWLGYNLDVQVKANGAFELDNLMSLREVTATKRIKAADINFANGTPTFIFKLAGVDADGETATYYEAISFNEEYVRANTGTDGYVSIAAVFKHVVPGNYTLREENVSRYEFESISDVVNGTIEGEIVKFDLITNEFGKATFTNKVYENQWFSHNDIVVNDVCIAEQ